MTKQSKSKLTLILGILLSITALFFVELLWVTPLGIAFVFYEMGIFAGAFFGAYSFACSHALSIEALIERKEKEEKEKESK